MQRLKNAIKVVIAQNLPAILNAAGEVTKKARNYFFEVLNETTSDITAEKAANFMLVNFLRFVEKEKLTRKDSFKLSKPLEITVEINGKTTRESVKIAMSQKRFQNALETTPQLLCNLFSHVTNVGQLTDSEAKKFIGTTEIIREVNGETHVSKVASFVSTSKKTVIAKAIAKIDVPAIEAPVAEAVVIPETV